MNDYERYNVIDASIKQQVQSNIEAAHSNLVTRLETSIERALTALAERNFVGAILNDVYRPVERKTWLRKRIVFVYKLDNGVNGQGVASWELDDKGVYLLLADGQIAFYGYVADRVAADIMGYEPTTSYATISPINMTDELLERLIEAVGALALEPSPSS